MKGLLLSLSRICRANLVVLGVSGAARQVHAVVLAAWYALDLSPQQILFVSLGVLFLWTLDLVSFNGGVGALVLDTIGHTFSQKYHNSYSTWKSGHFLIAYLLGILPKGYTLTSLDALKKEGSLNIQAGTALWTLEFIEEVNRGKVTATMLNRFSCIALAEEGRLSGEMGCTEHNPYFATRHEKAPSEACRGNDSREICMSALTL
ncbi:hypothetical protein HAX54_046948 [Datura stramonium]|uniref:Uncharacterized protein n=1 Tax=Datura stramonium TaxID=4076 RepID=A0ABS8RPW5_DATST|nr:hypothetical protein [Datura stramonium]